MIYGRQKFRPVRFDRESFDSLKELLRVWSSNGLGRPATTEETAEETAEHRRTREALKRVFDQIRDMEYDDGV